MDDSIPIQTWNPRIIKSLAANEFVIAQRTGNALKDTNRGTLEPQDGEPDLNRPIVIHQCTNVEMKDNAVKVKALAESPPPGIPDDDSTSGKMGIP